MQVKKYVIKVVRTIDGPQTFHAELSPDGEFIYAYEHERSMKNAEAIIDQLKGQLSFLEQNNKNLSTYVNDSNKEIARKTASLNEIREERDAMLGLATEKLNSVRILTDELSEIKAQLKKSNTQRDFLQQSFDVVVEQRNEFFAELEATQLDFQWAESDRKDLVRSLLELGHPLEEIKKMARR